MDIHPALAAVLQGHLGQFIDKAFAQFSILHHGAQFLIEKFMTTRPVYLLAGIGKVKGDELGKVTLNGVFPRAVVVVGGVHAGLSGSGDALSIEQDTGISYSEKYATRRLNRRPRTTVLLGKHPGQAVRIQRSIQPQLQLINAGGLQASEHVFRQRAEAFLQ